MSHLNYKRRLKQLLSPVVSYGFTYLCELLAVLLLFQLLPVPINLDVLLVRCDNFVLNFVASLLLLLLLKHAAVVLSGIGVRFDTSNGLISVTAHLLKVT